MINKFSKYLAILLIFSAPLNAFAADSSMRSYVLPNNGIIQLHVPASWQDQVRQPSNQLPPTIIFRPKSGNSFQILLTPMWDFKKGITIPDLSGIKTTVQNSAKHVSAHAVEKSIQIKKLEGTTVKGYYFTATDKAPRPGEYKYMTQVILRVGELAPTCTILSNDGAKNVIADTLKMLTGIVHVQSKTQLRITP